MKYKKSRYNISFKENNDAFLFNSLRRTYAKLSLDDYDFFSSSDDVFLSGNRIQCRERLFEGLKKGGFVVEEQFNEVNYLKTKIKMIQCQSGTLSLTMAPTLRCNFRCSYCYEKLENKTLSEDEVVKTIEFTKSNLERKKNLDLTWYGGEPLLATDIIDKMSKELIDYCDANNIRYKARIVTNGYLLDDEIAGRMLNWRINSAQITIDGPAEIHNKTRKLANGKGTFDKIIENIKRSPDHLKITIRVNVSTVNIDYLEQLLLWLKQRGLHTRIKIYFSNVTSNTGESHRFRTSCLRSSDFSIEKIKIEKIAYKLGFKVDFFPEEGAICGAVTMNNYVIAGDGFIYKCWNSVGLSEQAIGNLNNFNKFNYQHYDWLAYSPFDDAECSKCNILPLCMGNCPYFKVVNGKKSICSEYKYNLIETLKVHKLFKA